MRALNRLSFTLVALSTLIAAFIGSRQLSSNVSAVSQPQIYSMHFTRTSRNASSEVISRTSHFYGVRKDGSTVKQNIVDQPHGGPPRVTNMLFLPQETKSVVISHTLRRLSTKHLTAQQVERMQPQPMDAYCSSVANAANGRRLTGTEQLLGVDVLKYEARNSEQAETVYVAPLLGCSVLKSTSSWLKDGQVIEVASQEPVSINLDEPDASLFLIPAGYVESTPSEIRTGLWESVYPDKPVPECLRKGNQRDDASYARFRKR